MNLSRKTSLLTLFVVCGLCVLEVHGQSKGGGSSGGKSSKKSNQATKEKITSIDVTARTITTSAGKTYVVDPNVRVNIDGKMGEFSGLQAEMEVELGFGMGAKKPVISITANMVKAEASDDSKSQGKSQGKSGGR